MPLSLVSAEGATYALRLVSELDAERLFSWRNDPWVRSHMKNQAQILPEEHRAWFTRVLSDPKVNVFLFTIDGDPQGVMQLTELDLENRNARWGFYLPTPSVPRGSGSRMGFLTLEHAFGELALHRIYADVLASNEASLRMHRKLLFRDEGRQREQLRRANRFEDLLLLGVLAREWAAGREALRRELFGG